MQRLWPGICFCGVVSVSMAAQADPTVFNASIAGAGTCAIGFTPAGTLTLDSTSASSAIDATVPPVLSIKKTTLTFTGCTGWSGGLTPTLTVSGATSADNAVPTDRVYLLKSAGAAGGTSKGFGFVMGKATNGQITWGTGSTGIYSFAAPVDISLAAAGTTLAENTTKDIYFGLSCGTATGCARENVNAGTLSAALTFTFSYK